MSIADNSNVVSNAGELDDILRDIALLDNSIPPHEWQGTLSFTIQPTLDTSTKIDTVNYGQQVDIQLPVATKPIWEPEGWHLHELTDFVPDEIPQNMFATGTNSGCQPEKTYLSDDDDSVESIVLYREVIFHPEDPVEQDDETNVPTSSYGAASLPESLPELNEHEKMIVYSVVSLEELETAPLGTTDPNKRKPVGKLHFQTLQHPEGKCSIVKTRSGRVSKPNKDRQCSLSEASRQYITTVAAQAAQTATAAAEHAKSITTPCNANLNKRKRKISDQHICATCGKTYLGRRMQRHLQAAPGHKTVQMVAEEKQAVSGLNHAGLGNLKQPALEQQAVMGTMSRQFANLLETIRHYFSTSMQLCMPNYAGAVYIDDHAAELLSIRKGYYRKITAVGSTNRVVAPSLYNTTDSERCKVVQPLAKASSTEGTYKSALSNLNACVSRQWEGTDV